MGCARCKKRIIVKLACIYCDNIVSIQIREGNNPLAIAEQKNTKCKCGMNKFAIV